MMHEFKNCPVCDFQWHSSDGQFCPVCSPRKATARGIQSDESFLKSGLFGTGKTKKLIKGLYQCLGILALVYFLYQVFGGG